MPPPELIAWRERLEAARKATRHLPAQSASGLEGTEPEIALDLDEEAPQVAGLAKGLRDVELPPWTKGRYGSAIGRAVHGVLQTVDLATGEGLEDAVASQCVAEGVTEHAEVVRALARSALDSEVVKRAATRPHWRESYVGTRLDDGTILEGFIDLVFREDDGSLVILDYKTDAIPAGALESRVKYYAPQLAAYRSALEAASGKPTTARLLFLHPGAPAISAG
jgi:ATP-dependent exoDNAse (exonuclease V) beta subunit